MSYNPADPAYPRNFRLRWTFQRRKFPGRVISADRRGFGYQSWSNNTKNVADPMGTADFCQIWYCFKKIAFVFTLFRETY